MNCENIAGELIAYLDGRASEKERGTVEAHLKSCPACRERAEEFRRLWNVLEEAPAIEPSPGFDARLSQRMAAAPRVRRWGWLVPAPRLSFALALLLAASVWISLRPPAGVNSQGAPANSEEEFQMIKDLGVLENYDVLKNFDALSELPAARPSQTPPAAPQTGGGPS